ncbi:MAG: hypothetical protein EOP60_16050 [Sphingomonadales bacterium]|nr:MAG: hypothetical protein EOP60_16050 [Sphingomonadales bacterium]
MKGKKFNIWIAYSDLFTNLSTFLFIAALGVFASLGSMDETETEKAALCTIPAEVEQRLGATGMLTPIEAPKRVGSSCRRYYKIDGYRFHSRAPQLQAFMAEDRRMTLEEARERVCSPLWLTLGLQAFENQQGRIIVHGVGRMDNGWATGSPECKPELKVPATDHLGYGAQAASEKIEQCYAGINAGNICSEVSKCRKQTDEGVRPASTAVCRQILAVRAWHGAEKSECLRKTAVAQAQTIASICEALPSWKYFPDGQFVDSAMSQIARFDETRPALWRRSGVSGFARDAPVTASLDDAAKAILSQLPAGTVVVEVRLGTD